MNPELQKIVDLLIQQGYTKAVDALQDLDTEDEFTNTLLWSASEYLEKFGLSGIQKLADAVTKRIDGEDVELELDNLEVASDMLAALQVEEESQKSALKDTVAKVSNALAPILSSLIKGIL